MTQVLHHHGLRHEKDQEVQMTHKDYLLLLKSPPKEKTWGKKSLFSMKVTSAEVQNFMAEGL